MTIGIGMLSEEAANKIRKNVKEILNIIWDEAQKVAKENDLPLTEQLRIQNQLVLGLIQTEIAEHMMRQITYIKKFAGVPDDRQKNLGESSNNRRT